MSITRRFILLGGVSAGWLQLLARAWPAPHAPNPEAQRLRRLVGPAPSAREIGRRYLALAPEEANEAMLTQRVLSSLGTGFSLAGDDKALRAVIDARLKADFAEGKTAQVDGWILSRTEARLCALWAITSTAAPA